MITIKFSHYYSKFPEGFEQSRLLEVLPVRLEELKTEFLMWDTEYGEGEYYPLPKKGAFMILLLLTTEGRLWTTIRRYTEAKYNYYLSHVGETCRCEVIT